MASHLAFICLDMSLLTTEQRRKAECEVVYTKINSDLAPYYPSSLRAQIKPNPQDSPAYFWNDVWGEAGLPGQDTNHGNNVLSYMIEAHDLGLYWNTADIEGVRNLMYKVLWNRSIIEPSFAMYVDGSGGYGAFIADGFVKLGRYDSAIQTLLENMAPTLYADQFYANCALNAKRLSSIQTSPLATATPTTALITAPSAAR
jgi:hypothetical protein